MKRVKKIAIQILIGAALVALGYFGTEDAGRAYVKLRHYPEKTTGPIMFISCQEFDRGMCWLKHPDHSATTIYLTSPGLPPATVLKEIVYRDVKVGDNWKQALVRAELYKNGEKIPDYQ